MGSLSKTTYMVGKHACDPSLFHNPALLARNPFILEQIGVDKNRDICAFRLHQPQCMWQTLFPRPVRLIPDCPVDAGGHEPAFQLFGPGETSQCLRRISDPAWLPPYIQRILNRTKNHPVRGPGERLSTNRIEMSVTKIRGMASGCHLKCLHFW